MERSGMTKQSHKNKSRLLRFARNDGKRVSPNTIKETSQKVEKFGKNIKVVIICHAQVIHILKDIQSISEKIKTGEIEIKKGELPRVCWREFIERYKKKVNLSKDDIAMKHMSTIDISNLLKPELMRILEQEIEYLKSLK